MQPFDSIKSVYQLKQIYSVLENYVRIGIRTIHDLLYCTYDVYQIIRLF